MTTNVLPRQVSGARSFEGFDLVHLGNRITALENATTAVPGNVFYVKHFGAPSSQLGNFVRNLHDRVTALEASSTKPVHFSTRPLARRMPLGGTLYNLNLRVVALEG